MIELQYLWLSLLLLLGGAWAQCSIPGYTLSTNHVFLSYDNTAYSLLHSNIVPNNQYIYLLCGGGLPLIQSQCNNGVFVPPLPITNCAKELRVVAEIIQDPSCPWTMRRIGYNYGGIFLEVYRTCYDDQLKSAKFSIHMLYLSNDQGNINEYYFRKDALTAKEEAAYRNSNICRLLDNSFGPNHGVMQKDELCFDRGHLTPSRDFPFSSLMKATYSTSNIVPQFKKINNGNWKAVEYWIRRLLGTYNQLKVCTGTVGVQTLYANGRSSQIYLLDNQKIPLPEWTYKIISHISGVQYVVVTYNNPTPSRPPNPRAFCQIIGCDARLNRGGIGTTYCCEPFQFIRLNVPHLTGIC